MTNDLTNELIFYEKFCTCCNGGVRQDQPRMPVNTSMTTNGSAALRFQYNEFAICVHPNARGERVKSGMKLAENALRLVKSVNFSDISPGDTEQVGALLQSLSQFFGRAG